MTLVPQEPSPDPEAPTQSVSVRRRGAGEPMGGGSGAMGGIDLGMAASSVLGGAKRSLVSTAKWLMVFAVILAGAAAWWVSYKSDLRAFFAGLLVFFPAIVIALIAAARQGAAAMASETVRQSRLGGKVFGDLLKQLASPDADQPTADGPSMLLARDVAEKRLKEIVAAAKPRTAQGAILGALNPGGQILPILQRLMLPEFARQSQAGLLNLDRVRESLGPTVDESVASAMRADSRSAVMGAMLSMSVWAMLIAYLLGTLWR